MRALRAAVLALACACAGPPPDPPTAVVDASPTEVCAGDGFRTPIEITGARSSARLSLVPEPADPDAALRYRWSLEGSAHELVEGSLDAVALTVVMEADRPLHATLTVTGPEGGVAVTTRSLGVTVASTPPCDEGCPEGTSCVDAVCLPDGACEDDEACPPCFLCDVGLGRCVPRETP